MRHTLLALCLLATPLYAQSTQAKPDDKPDDPPAANPGRPTVTNPAHIPPPGYLQFEQGVLQGNGSSGLDRQFSVVQTTKLSLNHYVMLTFSSQPIAHSLVPPATNDTGDLTLGGQVLFNDEEEGRSKTPTIAIGYNRRVRAGTAPNLDIGGYSQGLTLFASGTLYGIHYDSNYLFNQQDASGTGNRPASRAQYGQSLSLTRQINTPFSITAELWHFTQPTVFAARDGSPVARANAVGLLFAPAYIVRPNLVLDCGFEHGLTSTSTQWEGFAGFTYLLPHRLWKWGRR